MRLALRLGGEVLEGGGTSVDAVERVLRSLEDDTRFNAGKGAVFTHEGTHELDSSLMDGATLRCGAVTGVRNIKNPISLARLVMDKSRHVFLAGEGASAFAAEMGVETAPDDYFFNQSRYDSWQKSLETDMFWEEKKKGTVGCVALDRQGNLAAGTSTGGITNKRFGRIGDSPVIGSGTYANNRTCAVSCTGHGETFIRYQVAYDVSALMEYGGLSLAAAADSVIHGKLPEGEGGLVALSKDGDVVFSFSTDSMFRGATDASGRLDVAIWKD
jgi:beta-aspartyl-peptidase (threonine type)